MRWSQTLIPTSKDAPADAATPSHQLLLRAGYVRQLAAGSYHLLPLGLRVLGKIESVLRSELRAAGALEVATPTLCPADLSPAAAEVFSLTDHRNRRLTLSPSATPALVDLAAATIRSYRQLPATLFRVGPAYRDDDRPRAGLLHPREYAALDAAAFTATPAAQADLAGALLGALTRALARCGLPVTPVPSPAGHDLLLPNPAGDDALVTSDADPAYLATPATAETGPRPWTFSGDPVGDLETIPTPDTTSVPDLARLLKIPTSAVLKTLVFRATPSAEWTGYETPENLTTPQWLIAVVRGDHEVNVHKLLNAVRETFHIQALAVADESAGDEFAFGYVGPDAAIKKVRAALVIDPDAAQDRPWVAGANEIGYHVRNFHWFRECGQPLADPRKVLVADIRNAVDGDPAPTKGTLHLTPALRIATLANHPTSTPAVNFQDESAKLRPALLTTLHVHLYRLLAAIVERHHDAHGIVWPAAVAPYSVILTPVQYTGETKDATDRLYADLTAAGVDVLLDDRDLRPGPKFADADLLGVPTRVTLGDRLLRQNAAELKQRSAAGPTTVPLADLLPWRH